jgi:hypothetical protein
MVSIWSFSGAGRRPRERVGRTAYRNEGKRKERKQTARRAAAESLMKSCFRLRRAGCDLGWNLVEQVSIMGKSTTKAVSSAQVFPTYGGISRRSPCSHREGTRCSWLGADSCPPSERHLILASFLWLDGDRLEGEAGADGGR